MTEADEWLTGLFVRWLSGKRASLPSTIPGPRPVAEARPETPDKESAMISLEHVHPMLVHFPIVFVVTLAGLDLVGALRGKAITGRAEWGGASAGLALLAGGSAIATYVFGDLALDVAETGGWHSEVAEMHEALGTASATILVAWAVLRGVLWLRDRSLTGWARAAIPAVEIAATAVVVATAYFGGELVYSLGVSVAHP